MTALTCPGSVATLTVEFPRVAATGDLTSAEGQQALTASWCVDAGVEEFRRMLRTSFDQAGAVLVRGPEVIRDDHLIAVGAMLGFVSARGNGNPPVLIHDVAVAQRPAETNLGSRRSSEFAPHTDSCGYPRPHRALILACQEPDPGGEGITSLTDIADLVRNLPSAVVEHLERVRFPFWPASGAECSHLDAPLLQRVGDAWRVRFRRDSLVTDPRIAALTEEQAELARLFENAGDSTPARRLLLKRGDVLVFDNTRMLHARTAFPPGSPRHLRRLKVHDLPGYENPAGAPDLS